MSTRPTERVGIIFCGSVLTSLLVLMRARGNCPLWVKNNKAQGEHNRSAFGCIASDPLLGGPH
jgi:hypothetical protein